MRFIDLFNIDKALADKERELEEKKIKLKELEEEIKLLELIFNDKSSSKNLIDISNVYVICKNNVIYFAKEKMLDLDYYDIFNGKFVCDYKTIVISDIISLHGSIKEVFKEVLVYPDGMVPKELLQYLYYKANDINSDMVQNVRNLGLKIH